MSEIVSLSALNSVDFLDLEVGSCRPRSWGGRGELQSHETGVAQSVHCNGDALCTSISCCPCGHCKHKCGCPPVCRTYFASWSMASKSLCACRLYLHAFDLHGFHLRTKGLYMSINGTIHRNTLQLHPTSINLQPNQLRSLHNRWTAVICVLIWASCVDFACLCEAGQSCAVLIFEPSNLTKQIFNQFDSLTLIWNYFKLTDTFLLMHCDVIGLPSNLSASNCTKRRNPLV